ncbi:MAG TPA: hypothetical protein VIM69_01560 [Opitutaceae bacterium]
MNQAASPLTLPTDFDLAELNQRLQEAYPSATPKMISSAIEACRLEVGIDGDTSRFIRCVCERMIA